MLFIFIWFYNILFLDSLYDIKYLSIFPVISYILTSTLHTITGNILGESSLNLSKGNKDEGKYSMTMDVYSLNYLHHLNDNIYSQFSNTKIYVYPNVLLSKH